jgi:hypothetical protein
VVAFTEVMEGRGPGDQRYAEQIMINAQGKGDEEKRDNTREAGGEINGLDVVSPSEKL